MSSSVARIRQSRSFARVTGFRSPGQDVCDDRHPGHAGDVTDDLVQQEIHLMQGFLHMLDMTGGSANDRLAMAEQRAEVTAFIRGTKGWHE